MLDTTTEIISQLLQGTVEALDIPEELHATAVEEYEYVGNWLADHADIGGDGWLVYPQGSFLLGTVVRPYGLDHYDLDAVCRRGIAKESTTQAALKADVGGVLRNYVAARKGDAGGPYGIEERKRCWTLNYSMPFHLDVLPAIPNPDGLPTGILLTDKTLHAWQHSDPIAYAAWFKERMKQEFIVKRMRLAEAARTAPEKIPDARVKTTLQQVVQVLKSHRNQFFANDLERRPATILVTTLAAHAYRGERDLNEAVLEAVELMPSYVEQDGEVWQVPNPVEPRENFADKWSSDPERAKLFFAWLDQLTVDLNEASERHGLDKVTARLSESFGLEPVQKAAGRLGALYLGEREQGRLRFATSTGVLSGAGALPVKRHGFYGDSSAC